jgi:hypothetical protein
MYEPPSVSTMHRQPKLETEAVQRAERFECRLVETRGHHSDVDDSDDEFYDDNCSNRSTDGISSSAGSSNNSFDGSWLLCNYGCIFNARLTARPVQGYWRSKMELHTFEISEISYRLKQIFRNIDRVRKKPFFTVQKSSTVLVQMNLC